MFGAMLLRRGAGGATTSSTVRRVAQAAASGQVKQYARPERTRDMMLHNAGKGIVQCGVLVLGLGTVLWFGVLDRQRRHFLNYWKTVDVEKVYFRQRQAGVFQSVRPLKEDSPEFWMGTYRGSEGSESKDEFISLLNRFPELEVKVIKK